MKPLKNLFSRRYAALFITASLSLLPALARDKDNALPNFQKVNGQIYRGAQPDQDGFERLAKMGIRTIVDLQEFDGRARSEERLVSSLGMRYINIPMRGMEVPSDAAVQRAIAIMNDSSSGPVFVHCHRGADRTGMVVACYRIQHDGWERKKALKEASKYGMSWYQFPLKAYVLRYSPSLDRGVLDADANVPAGGHTVETPAAP